MRWLCIHGTGSSGAIFQDQLAPMTTQLEQKGHTFEFLDGPFTCKPAVGLSLRYPTGPYYTWWTEPTSAAIRTACATLHTHLQAQTSLSGPYDGVLSFSRGCLLVSAYIHLHQATRPSEPLPFRTATFLCGGPSLSILSDLGLPISEKVKEWDRKTKVALRERGSNESILKHGRDRWLIPGPNGDAKLGIDPDADIDTRDVYGLDTVSLPAGIRINIPTAHLVGRVDPRLPASLWLVNLSEENGREVFVHPGGHNIPRSEGSTKYIAEMMERSVRIGAR
ncbi:hypothetical protein N7488_005138 [Penicillium malachiteum]|nr:hypothetical protein N7488_005138 [Penicillium malachiteum]